MAAQHWWAWHWQAVFAAALLLITYLLVYVRKLRWRSYGGGGSGVADGLEPGGHRWCRIDHFDRPSYCAVTGERMLEGRRCQHCGLCVSTEATSEPAGGLEAVGRALPCKPVSLWSAESASSHIRITPHHWVEGNLPPYSRCQACGEPCGQSARLCDLRCAWCQRCFHPDCRSPALLAATAACDFGRYAEVTVPPHCLRLDDDGGGAGGMGEGALRRSQHHQLRVVEVQAPRTPLTWRPLLVLGNRMSGGGEGDAALQRFRAVLNPAQVLDLSSVPPKVALGWCHLLPKGVTARILVCGGDGTVGWVLSAIEELGLSPPPPLAVFPLGTGNDLSRVLGWGPGSNADDLDSGVDALLGNLANASVDRLDRWQVTVQPARMWMPPRRRLTMSNYFSLGVDALVALNFDSARRTRPALTGTRLINKLWYFGYGTRDLWERACRNLHRRLLVTLDGRLLNLPELEGLVVLNIASWGSGCLPWGAASTETPDAEPFRPQSHGDARFEVMGLLSSFHMAQLQVGLAPAIRLGQGAAITITIKRGGAGKVPVQADGEPWLQGPCTISIGHKGQAVVLRCQNSHGGGSGGCGGGLAETSPKT